MKKDYCAYRKLSSPTFSKGQCDKKPDNPEVIKHMKKETIVQIVSCLLLLSLRGNVIRNLTTPRL